MVAQANVKMTNEVTGRPHSTDGESSKFEAGGRRSRGHSPKGRNGSSSPIRVLVTVPDLRLPGGVTGLYNQLRLDLEENLEYFSINFGVGRFKALFLPYLYVRFCRKVSAIDVVHLNPSLDPKSYFRDMVFCVIAKRLFSRRTIVYWHGWDGQFAHKLLSVKLLKWLHSATFSYADVHMVLARSFERDLRSLGVQGDILLESNVASRVDGCDVGRSAETGTCSSLKLLYISRITEGKGWDIALHTMALLRDRGVKDVQLTIAGDGDRLGTAHQMAADLGLGNVEFCGYVAGTQKELLFGSCHVLFFPTCYPEGMPLVILEAMMHGMPVVTRRVGGIGDHIDNRCGLVTDSRKPETFADYIALLARDRVHLVNVAGHNRRWALDHFAPERLSKRLWQIYRGVVR